MNPNTLWPPIHTLIHAYRCLRDDYLDGTDTGIPPDSAGHLSDLAHAIAHADAALQRLDHLHAESLGQTTLDLTRRCEWTPDDADVWDTHCGHRWGFVDGGPEENGMHFCCYCGELIHVTHDRPEAP